MYCSNCGNKLDKDEKFCTNCGKEIKKESNEEEKLNKVNNNYNNEEYTEVQKKEKSKKILNAFWINGLTGLIVYFGFMTFWYLVNGQFYIPLFLKIVIIGCCVLNFLKLVILEEYSGKCPYCKSDLKILGDSADCPKCNKRIIVKDDKFYKV